MYLFQNYDFWNYDIPFNAYMILAFCMISIVICAFIFNTMRNIDHKANKKKRIIYIILFALSLIVSVYSIVLLAQLPEPQRKEFAQFNNITNIEEQQ